MNATERHRALTSAYHAVRQAKLKLNPVEEALADSIWPDAEELLTYLSDAHDLLAKAGALTSHLSEQEKGH